MIKTPAKSGIWNLPPSLMKCVLQMYLIHSGLKTLHAGIMQAMEGLRWELLLKNGSHKNLHLLYTNPFKNIAG